MENINTTNPTSSNDSATASTAKVSKMAALTTSPKLRTLKSKAKTGLAVVGAASLATIVIVNVAKKKGSVESLEVSLPSVDVNTTSEN